MNRNYPILRFPLIGPSKVKYTQDSVFSGDQMETLDFVRGCDYIAAYDPLTGKEIRDGAVLLDLWTCRECGEQFTEHDGVEEFLALHTKKHAYGLIRSKDVK